MKIIISSLIAACFIGILIAVFGFGSSDTTPENIEPIFMGHEGQITRVIDGDTLLIDQTKIRLSLVNSPELNEYGRSVGLVYCNDMMLNKLLLTNGHAEISTYYCDKSEFGNDDWARAYGC